MSARLVVSPTAGNVPGEAGVVHALAEHGEGFKQVGGAHAMPGGGVVKPPDKIPAVADIDAAAMVKNVVWLNATGGQINDCGNTLV